MTAHLFYGVLIGIPVGAILAVAVWAVVAFWD